MGADSDFAQKKPAALPHLKSILRTGFANAARILSAATLTPHEIKSLHIIVAVVGLALWAWPGGCKTDRRLRWEAVGTLSQYARHPSQ